MFLKKSYIVILIIIFTCQLSSAQEPPLQNIFNNLGYSLDIVSDEIYGDVFFQVQDSYAEIIAQYSSYQLSSAIGWYIGDLATNNNDWLIGGANTGLATQAAFPDIDDVFGLNLWTNYDGNNPNDFTWYSQSSLNYDGADHLRVFQNRLNGQLVPHSYVLAWEDLPNLGDADFQDIVIQLDGVQAVQGSGAPVNPGGGQNNPSAVPEPATMILFSLGLVGAGVIRRKKK